jgi:hypothetical protein
LQRPCTSGADGRDRIDQRQTQGELVGTCVQRGGEGVRDLVRSWNEASVHEAQERATISRARGCYFFSYFLLADTDVIERGESKAEDERCSNEWRTSLREG